VAKAGFATLIALVAFVYVSIAIGTQDYLWFLGSRIGTPRRITVHINGHSVQLGPGDPGFEEVHNALRATISQIRGYPQGIGISEETLSDYRETYWSVKAEYDEPIRLRSRFRFGEPTELLLPLTGRHTEHNVLFLGRDGKYYTGPSLRSTGEVQRVLAEHDLAPDD
jgi:hypothetical protein